MDFQILKVLFSGDRGQILSPSDGTDETDTRIEDEIAHPLFFVIRFLFDDLFLTVLNINSLLLGHSVELSAINRVPLIAYHL